MTTDEKIKELAAQDKTATEIANILGLNPFVVRRKCYGMGIVLPFSSYAMPHGITDQSYELRMALGSIIVDMRAGGLKNRDISEITGLGRRQITAAETRPYKHDWSLSQIERTLAHANKTLKEVI
jgi:hypothetical protein